MPAWWGKKSCSSKNKKDDQENKKKKVVEKKVVSRSFDESGLAGTRTPSSSGFSGFDSDRKGHPLPQPVMNNTTTSSGFDVSGSVSSSGGDSSVSSSAAADDHFRGNGDAKVISQPRSPGPGSRVATTTTSPRHPRFSGSNLESPNKRIEEGHPLPLPPTSPTSPPTRICNSPSRPSIVPNVKNAENASCQLSKWKKGRLLGRGTFGHVYLGFNSQSGQMCAIKEVKVVGDDQSSKESLKQLNQEITLLSHLSHPNIVQYYGSELVFFWLKLAYN